MATKVTIVGWLFRESVGWLACTERSLPWLLRSPLTSCLLGCRGSWRWTLLSVGGVPLLSGRICRSHLGVWGLAMGNKAIQDCGFFLFGTGVSQTPCCCCLCCLCRLGRRSLLYSLAFVGLAVRGFLVFLEFSAPFFRIYFHGLLKSAWSWRCGGQHCWGRVIPGGLRLATLRRISFVFCSFFCYSWALGHREA